MQFTVQRRLAAHVLGCSPKKVWFDPALLDKIKEAITTADIRGLIVAGRIRQKPDEPRSRGRARDRKAQRQKGRQKGFGSRKGRKNARTPQKESWMNRIRLQRTFLKQLRQSAAVTPETYHATYLKAKGGFFRSKRHLALFLEENALFSKKAKEAKNRQSEHKQSKQQ